MKTEYRAWIERLSGEGWGLYPLEIIDGQESAYFKCAKEYGNGIPCYSFNVFYALWWQGRYVWSGKDYLVGYRLWERRYDQQKQRRRI